MKSKIDFITDLLSNKKLHTSQKERIFSLVAEDLKGDEHEIKKIWEEINILKSGTPIEILAKNPDSKLDDSTDTDLLKNDNKTQDDVKPLPDYIDPHNVAEFLLKFNQNPILKTISHLIDSDDLSNLNNSLKIPVYNYHKHLEGIKKEYKELSDDYYNKLVKGLHAKIYAYINGGKGWSVDDIKINWTSDLLKEWCDKNPNKCPNPEIEDLKEFPFYFPAINLKDGIIINNFNDVVLHFKKEITIRHDNNLSNLCKIWSFEFKDKVNFNYDKIRTNIEFFTDVEKLRQAFVRIIRMCISESKDIKPEITLELMESNNEILFSIRHLNSKFNKSILSFDRYGTEFSNLISNQINGLCDLILDADFGNNEYYHKSIWPKNTGNVEIQPCDGVCFILKFYR